MRPVPFGVEVGCDPEVIVLSPVAVVSHVDPLSVVRREHEVGVHVFHVVRTQEAVVTAAVRIDLPAKPGAFTEPPVVDR